MIAEEFVRPGVRTSITSRKEDVCEATARKLSEYGECIAIPQDLSTAEGIAADGSFHSFSKRDSICCISSW
jgi:short-subunit dehydrogenase